jgi:HEAT repeat protein
MSPEPVQTLIARLSDRKGMVRDQARDDLIKIGSPAVPNLLPLADVKDKQLRWEVAKALGSIGDPRAIDALIARLSDKDPGIQWLGAVGLINIGVESIPATLHALIADPDSRGIREAAHHILNDLSRGDENLRPILKPVIDSVRELAPIEAVSPKALEALKQLTALQV